MLTTADVALTDEDMDRMIKKAVNDALDALPRWKPVRDMAFIRELPVEQTGLIVSPIDLNRSRENTPILKGIVEAIGPGVTEFKVGDTVWYEIDAGEFRLPWDDPVRIMYEGQVMSVERGS